MIKIITLLIIMGSSVPYKVQEAEVLAMEVIDAARSNDLDPILYAVLLEQESHWDPRARSRVGAYGLPQLHPAYWPPSVFKTRWQQLYQGATILATYRDKCGGSWRAVAAYRSGKCSTVGPATTRVFQNHHKWTARWRALQNEAIMPPWPRNACVSPTPSKTP